MQNQPTPRRQFLFVLALLIVTTGVRAGNAAENPFIGEWALTIPGGAAGWLGVSENGGKLSVQMMWGAGSVEPVKNVSIDHDSLIITRTATSRRDGNITETITAKRDGDTLRFTTAKKRADGTEFAKADFTGKLQPPIPPAPDLSKVRFAAPIQLFNGKDLTGWRLTDPKADNGWAAKDGLLVNEQTDRAKHYGNLRTDAEFEDFNITLEANVAKGDNSGVYIRGIYEIQVADTLGRKLDPHNMGAVYSRITPTQSAEKPAGQWQTLDITFVDRHMTVILNGIKIIDNQAVHGCTGSQLFSDVTRPGPIYLQGDHTGIQYRNIVLKPVVK